MRVWKAKRREIGHGLLPVILLVAALTGLAPKTYAADAARETQGEVSPDADELPLPPSILHDVRGTLDGVYNDIFYFGQSATLTGKLLDNGFFFAQTVRVRDTVVEGDLLVFAQQTTIDAEVLGDVYVFTANLEITENAVIHGNVRAFAGLLVHDGVIRGDLTGGGGETYVNGSARSVSLECGEIDVGPATRVAGDFSYEAKEEAEIAPEAVIGGEVRWNPPDSEDGEDDGGGISAWSVGFRIWRYVAFFALGAAILAVGGAKAREPAARLRERPAQGLGFGFVVAVVAPVACAVALITVVGIPLGVAGLLLYVVALFVFVLVAAQAVGDWILGSVRRGAPVNPYAALAVGLLAYHLLVWIPYVGFLVRLAAIIAGFGGVYLAFRPIRDGSTPGAAAPVATPTGA